jgi:CRAL/TRIO domain
MTDPLTMEQRNAKALELLPALKEVLQQDCNGVKDDDLLMFLRWKPSVDRAAGRYRKFLQWKRRNPGLFDETLRVSKDQELYRLLQTEVIVTIPGLVTKAGGTLLIGRFRNNDMTDGRTTKDACRMLFYTIDRVMERPETQSHGVTIIHDLRGFDRNKNARLEIAKTIFQGLLGHFPLHINAIYLWKAPPFFPIFFQIVSNLVMTKKIRERVHFIDDLSEIESVVDQESLLTELGGRLEWSAKDWVEECKQREFEGTFRSMTNIGLEI